MEVYPYVVRTLDSDWVDVNKLWVDMTRFAREHKGLTFFPADDSGESYSPRREPRLGWKACDQEGVEVKRWTITIRYFQRTFRRPLRIWR